MSAKSRVVRVRRRIVIPVPSNGRQLVCLTDQVGPPLGERGRRYRHSLDLYPVKDRVELQASVRLRDGVLKTRWPPRIRATYPPLESLAESRVGPQPLRVLCLCGIDLRFCGLDLWDGSLSLRVLLLRVGFAKASVDFLPCSCCIKHPSCGSLDCRRRRRTPETGQAIRGDGHRGASRPAGPARPTATCTRPIP